MSALFFFFVEANCVISQAGLNTQQPRAVPHETLSAPYLSLRWKANIVFSKAEHALARANVCIGASYILRWRPTAGFRLLHTRSVSGPAA
jgi:hypothetical protein